MNRLVLGAVAALLLASAGIFWWQGRAELAQGVPPPDLAGAHAPADAAVTLPSTDPHGRGPALPGSPAAKKAILSTEQKRFNRYDKNHDGRITRNEMLSTRVKAFQKLDTNHDNLLTFEEWAVKTSDRFKEIDRNGDGVITREELDAYYAAKDAKQKARAARCSCGDAGEAPPKGAKRRGGDGSDEDAGDPLN